MNCAELEALSAELALGTVSGAERGAALDHLAGCPSCREIVDQLARAADSLLLLAPVAEPPPGFESRVLSRLAVARTPVPLARGRRRRRVLVAAAAVALIGALSGAGASLLSDDRASTVAGGAGPTEVRTSLLRDDEGRWTCRAFVYGDGPTWLVVSLDRIDGANSTYSVEAVHTGSPNPVPVGTFALQDGHGTFAKAVEVPAQDVQGIRVLDAGGRVRYEMTFPTT